MTTYAAGSIAARNVRSGRSWGKRAELTPEEKAERRAAGKAKASEAIDRLEAGVRRLIEDDEAFSEYLRLSARMHRYSWGNRMLVYLARPDAGLVAGFHAWKELGRPVRKGSKGIQILAPMVRKLRDDEDGDEDERRVIGFRVAYVFSVHDTDGPPIGMPAVLPPTDDSETARDLFALLAKRAADLGCALDVREGPELGNGTGGPAGWYVPESRAIVVNGALPAAHRAKTLAHELAHHVAGQMDRRDAETVAEGAAFVVAGYFGLPTDGYSVPYVARWAEDMGRVRALLESIAVVADEILSGLDHCPECGELGGCLHCQV